MSYFQLTRPNGLYGEIELQGSKNAALPMIAAAVLCKGVTVLDNCPDISDVREMTGLLESIGCTCRREKKSLVIDASETDYADIPAADVKKLRSSVVMLGVLLGRMGSVQLSYPGGCKIGNRKIDIHLQIFRELGYETEEHDDERIMASGRVHGDCHMILRYASVGATENGILASVLSDGYIVILENVAREPEIVELCNMLNGMGADITGAGSSRIMIKGVKELHESRYTIGSDRIVAGTYAAAAVAAGGRIVLHGVRPHIDSEVMMLCSRMGLKYTCEEDNMVLEARVLPEHHMNAGDFIISTAPYPGFPTDMQSQFMAVMCKKAETGIIVENVFENRLNTADMLKKMGADIQVVSERVALINGVSRLTGCTVQAPDLRGGAALVIAGLVSDGETIVEDAEYIERGYENLERDFRELGVNIKMRRT